MLLMFYDLKIKIAKKLFSAERYARFIGVNLGYNCLIGKSHWSTEPYLITVGNNVQLTNCKIHTHGGGQVLRLEMPDFDCFGKVIIEDYAYIGTNSQIMPGVTIGRGSLVAAGSIVTKSIPAEVVVGGNPARILCTVAEFKHKNSKFNTHSKGLTNKNKRKLLLEAPAPLFIEKDYIK